MPSFQSHCCGFAGSREDNLRIQQSLQIVGEIRKLREGAFGDTVKDLPIVVSGDYNLVGSRKPLDVLNDAGLIDVLPKDPNTVNAHTWRGLSATQSFWPDRLDLVTQTKDLKPLRALILNTEKLKQWQHQELGGTKKDDSRASDHLMLICDFK